MKNLIFKHITVCAVVVGLFAVSVHDAFAYRVTRVIYNSKDMSVTLFDSGKYLLNDIALTCETVEACKVYAARATVQNAWYAGTLPRVSYTLFLEYYEGTTLKWSGSMFVPTCASCKFNYGNRNFVLKNGTTTGFTIINGASHMKVFADTKYTDPTQSASFPIITSLSTDFGIGQGSPTSSAAISLPTISNWTYATATDSFGFTTEVHTRANGSTIQDIEVLGFARTPYRLRTLVNMQTYTRMSAYKKVDSGYMYTIPVDPLANVSPDAKFSVPGSYLDSFGLGTYVIGSRAADYEGVQSVPGVKYSNPIYRVRYEAPPYVNAYVSTTTKKATVTWTKPTKLSNGQTIATSTFGGYIILFKNRATGLYSHTFRTATSSTGAGYATTRYVTPIALPPASYDVQVCGWSLKEDLGKCRPKATPIVVQ